MHDVALGLLELGHEPVVYSRRLGDVAATLRRRTITVVDDLEKLDQAPDVIHAHHHLEAMTALTRYPNVPALYVCHGWLPAEEAPPDHPRIRRYVAVDQLVRRRLVEECSIPGQRIEVLLNFVDLDRFPRREPLPRAPVRALVYSNQISESNHLPAIREACGERGILLEAVGARVQRISEDPGELLPRYDVVFAKGRAALEAAASGTSVVLCDAAGLGEMVTSTHLDRVRDYNFGVHLLQEAIDAESVGRQLDRFDSGDAGRVTERLRQSAAIGPVLERLLELYRSVVEEQASSPADPGEESMAMSCYLRRGPLRGGDLFAFEKLRMQEELVLAGEYGRQLEQQIGEQSVRLAEAAEGTRILEHELAVHQREARQAQSSLEPLSERVRILETERVRHLVGLQEAAERLEGGLQESRRLLEEECVASRLRLDEAAEQTRVRDEEISALRDSLTESEGRRQSEISALRDSLAESEGRRQSEVSALRDSLAEWENRHQSEVSALRAELQSLRRKRVALNVRVEELQAVLDRRVAELEEYQSSKLGRLRALLARLSRSGS